MICFAKNKTNIQEAKMDNKYKQKNRIQNTAQIYKSVAVQIQQIYRVDLMIKYSINHNQVTDDKSQYNIILMKFLNNKDI